ncbi:hypothetical protein [Bacteroides zhangwenhongii]|uniref:hypothetical protein n=1 Tax=Bacteroides zhangwenhongii TaxID=2650157 RepID=UPI0022E2ACD7|nr:hypothetical protein [Bacteroides zhangwenhongii]
MEGWIVLGLILIVIAYFLGRIGFAVEEDKERSEYAKTNAAIDKAIDAEDSKTRNLLIKTLMNMGCRSEENKETGRIRFIYQGEYFSIDAEDESPFITVWDTYWARVSLENLDINKLKDAINETNISMRPTIFYSIEKEESEVCLHCKYTMPFIIGIPDINNYLQANLNNFFIAHECLKVEFKNLGEKDVQQNIKGRTIIKGFNIK